MFAIKQIAHYCDHTTGFESESEQLVVLYSLDDEEGEYTTYPDGAVIFYEIRDDDDVALFKTREDAEAVIRTIEYDDGCAYDHYDSETGVLDWSNGFRYVVVEV